MRTTILRHMSQKSKEDDVLENEQYVHPSIERAARAISDWHSEHDWIFQIERAKRVIDAIAGELNREGHREASSYLQRLLINNEPMPRVPDPVVNKDKDKFSTMYF